MNVSTPGVVERASKEISRRIHSLGFKTSKRTKSVDEGGQVESGTGSCNEQSDQIKAGSTDKKKKTRPEDEKQAAAISESDR